MTARLYHYCCSHAAPKIDDLGLLLPSVVPWREYDRHLAAQGRPVSGLRGAPTVLWLTDMERPDRGALGLTNHRLTCDRTEFRYTVDAAGCEPWAVYVARWRPYPDWLADLEFGREPGRWWVSTRPCRIIERIHRKRARAKAGAR